MDTINEQPKTTEIKIHHAITWAPDESAFTLVLVGESRIPLGAVKEVLELYLGRVKDAIDSNQPNSDTTSSPSVTN